MWCYELPIDLHLFPKRTIEDGNKEEASLNQQLATLHSDILAANQRLDDQISDNSELNKLVEIIFEMQKFL